MSEAEKNIKGSEKPSEQDEMMLEFVSGENNAQDILGSGEENPKWYEQIKKDALLSVGNNGRLDGVLKRMEQGEKVSVVAIGGSVTEGAGASTFDKAYADLFAQGLAKAYPKAEVNFLNVGFSGTPSSLGVIRYDHDVTQKLSGNPDIVVIEFAVNDWQEETKSRAYESMIKNILTRDEKTAVILMFAVFRNKWNLEELYTGMGELYGLPMVSAKIGSRKAFEEGLITDEQFFFDEYHPTGFGHKVMADSLLYMVEQKKASFDEKKEISFDKVVAGTEFTNMHMVEADSDSACSKSENSKAVVCAGGFCERDKMIQGFQRTGEAEFANNWMHTATSGKESFQATFVCKNILIDCKTSNQDSFGKALIYVDGKLVREVNGYSQGGWNNSNVMLILDEKEVAEHTLEVKMAQGEEDKCFTILTIGYTD